MNTLHTAAVSTPLQGRILVVEDEKNLGQTLLERLHKEGFDVKLATTKEEAELELSGTHYDLALLDVVLPDGTGFEIAQRVRRERPATALMFLTALSSPDDRVRGLELGAEDYITKPFHLKELLLRVRNALKRARYLAAAHSVVSIGSCTVDFSKYLVTVASGTDGSAAQTTTQSITAKECALLKFLYERKGQAVRRDEILNEVWAEGEFPTTRTVDNFIVRLRRILGDDADQPQLIKSVRGVGYMLCLEAEKDSEKKSEEN